MRFARFVLLAQALFMLAFSLAYWVRPYEMANLNGMLLMESASISHMRVYYGGLQLGLALFLHPILLGQTWLAWTWWIPVTATAAAAVTALGKPAAPKTAPQMG